MSCGLLAPYFQTRREQMQRGMGPSMRANMTEGQSVSTAPDCPQTKPSLKYEAPQLRRLGSLAEITLGSGGPAPEGGIGKAP